MRCEGFVPAQAVQPIGSYGRGDLGDCFGTKAGVISVCLIFVEAGFC